MQQIKGAITALVTPMRDGRIDEQGLVDLIEFQINAGIHGLVPCGTTGESATLDFDEHKRVIELTVQTVAGRVPVIAGTGANSTLEAIELTESAKASGADAVLSVVPYYNKPSQEGLYRHFKAIVEAVDIPVVLYNVPGRTVADMLPETALRLAQLPGVIGIKEATGNLDRAAWLIKQAPKGFSIFSGDDPTAVHLMTMGGHGNISVTANVAPRDMAELCKAAMAQDAKRAIELHMKLLPLHKQLFVEPNPIPVKWALAHMGKAGGALRLPLTPLSPASQELAKAALHESGVL